MRPIRARAEYANNEQSVRLTLLGPDDRGGDRPERVLRLDVDDADLGDVTIDLPVSFLIDLMRDLIWGGVA